MESKYTTEYIEANADSVDWRDATMMVDFHSMSAEFFNKFASEWNWDLIHEFDLVPKEFVKQSAKR